MNTAAVDNTNTPTTTTTTIIAKPKRKKVSRNRASSIEMVKISMFRY